MEPNCGCAYALCKYHVINQTQKQLIMILMDRLIALETLCGVDRMSSDMGVQKLDVIAYIAYHDEPRLALIELIMESIQRSLLSQCSVVHQQRRVIFDEN